MSNTSPTPNDTRQKIIQAASQLFAEKGFASTTTREIAERAQINEVTLFRHFGTKKNLAKTVIEQYGGPAIAEGFEHRLTGDYEKDLFMFGHMLMNVMSEKSETIRMVICEAGNFPELQDIAAENPRQLRKMLARYFEKQIAAGVIIPGHPEVLAQSFMGMFFSYIILEGAFSDTLKPEISKEAVIQQFTELFIRGTINHREEK